MNREVVQRTPTDPNEFGLSVDLREVIRDFETWQ